MKDHENMVALIPRGVSLHVNSKQGTCRGVPNIPSIVPRYASTMLSTIITEHVIDLTECSSSRNRKCGPHKDGKLLDEAIIKSHNLK